MPKILKSVRFESEQRVPVGIKPLVPPQGGTEGTAGDGAASGAHEPDKPSRAESSAPLAEAQAHVEAMLSQARMQVASWRVEAREAGWQEGYREARKAVEAELDEALRTARALAESAIEARDAFLRDERAAIGRLAVAIAEKIIGRELASNPETVIDIVLQAIEVAGVQESCRIRVHPEDYAILSPHWDRATALQRAQHTWELVADKRLSRGGCVIEAGGGTIDAVIRTQLAQIESAFEGLPE